MVVFILRKRGEADQSFMIMFSDWFVIWMKKFFIFLLFSVLCWQFKPVSAQFNTIIFIPQDNRPISFQQTVANIRNLGYEVIVPPEKFLGSRNFAGDPVALDEWLVDNASRADVIVASSDALVYGSLVASRKHHEQEKVLLSRLDTLRIVHKKYPYIPIYIFSSVMRTPQSSAASSEEPAYYKVYGTDIARYTALVDKTEKSGLTHSERREKKKLLQAIPKTALHDWLYRRQGNYAVNKQLLDMAQEGVISYLALGCDDNAMYSQTDLECRHLNQYAKEIKCQNFASVAGVDELAMVLLTRAVNTFKGDIPFVATVYPPGKGEFTIPAYSNETLKQSTHTHIMMTGGLPISNTDNADVILLENTTIDGKTYAANTAFNNSKNLRPNTVPFANLVGKYLHAQKNVAVADVAFGNGADNALMNIMWKRDYLNKLGGYSGWNTPTNSSGYVMGMGMLANYADRLQVNKMLMTRYLDDWLYQANIRQQTASAMSAFQGQGNYGNTGTRTQAAEAYATRLMRADVEYYGLEKWPDMAGLEKVRVLFPWHRLFEAEFEIAN